MTSVKVMVTRSAGSDGAVLLMVDTGFEPDGSDGDPGLRVLINDQPVFIGKRYVSADEPRTAVCRSLEVELTDLEYLGPGSNQFDSVVGTRGAGAGRRIKILGFVAAYGAREHRSPTLAEIAAGVGLVGPSSVQHHLAKLVQAGLLEHEANDAGRQTQRTIRATAAGRQALAASTENPEGFRPQPDALSPVRR